MLSVTPSGQRADDWICTSISRFTRAEPFSVEPRRHCLGAIAVLDTLRARVGASVETTAWHVKHECEESNPVRQFWRLAALPGAHSCKGSRPEGREPSHFNYFFSSAFQYASLINFDQLSIRMSCVA